MEMLELLLIDGVALVSLIFQVLYASNRSNASVLCGWSFSSLYQIFSEALASPAYMVATPLGNSVVNEIMEKLTATV